jgi:LPXTG-motif cell wall-anchored protein
MTTDLVSLAGTGSEGNLETAAGKAIGAAIVGAITGLFKKKHYLYYLFTWDAGAGKWISQGTSMDPDGIKATAKGYNSRGVQTSINATGVMPAPLGPATGIGSSKVLVFVGIGIVLLIIVFFVIKKGKNL